eukprot:gene435-1833_t
MDAREPGKEEGHQLTTDNNQQAENVQQITEAKDADDRQARKQITGSLQHSFIAWRKSKLEKKKQKELDPILSLPRDDPIRMAYLRQRFVDLARQYVGVPYGRKFHEAEGCECEGCVESGRQLFQDKFSLDCCGLVRKVLRDLEQELGFRIGRGNQAYQYDTLPLRVDSAQELQPGDLVFYSGFTGEATIGSRERLRWVKEYPSYNFNAKRWTLLEMFYCRIDTWLQGACVPEHPDLWKSKAERWKGEVAKYSIFSGEGDEDADADDEGEDC